LFLVLIVLCLYYLPILGPERRRENGRVYNSIRHRLALESAMKYIDIRLLFDIVATPTAGTVRLHGRSSLHTIQALDPILPWHNEGNIGKLN
jgi:hypothetical protein